MGTDKSQDDSKIGYGQPPKHSRFQPGQSGNRAGRPKGSRNLSTDVRQTLQTPVKLNDSGKPKRLSTQQAVLMRLREKALKGDSRSLDRLLEYARIYNNDSEAAPSKGSTAEEDRDILAAYAAQIRATGST